MTLNIKITELGGCVGTGESALFEFHMCYEQILSLL